MVTWHPGRAVRRKDHPGKSVSAQHLFAQKCLRFDPVDAGNGGAAGGRPLPCGEQPSRRRQISAAATRPFWSLSPCPGGLQRWTWPRPERCGAADPGNAGLCRQCAVELVAAERFWAPGDHSSPRDRKRAGWGKGVSEREVLGGRRITKKNKKTM